MRNKTFKKRLWAAAVCLMMVAATMPLTAYADGTYTFPSYSQSGNNNSVLRYYLTDENAGDITVEQFGNHPAIYLDTDEGWYFEKWDTYFNGYEDRAILSDTEVKGSNPVNEDGYYTFYNISQSQAFVDRPFLYIATGTGYYGDHKVTAVLKPIVTVNADAGINYSLITDAPTTVSADKTAVKYKDDVTITYSVDDKYVLTAVDASGTKDIEIDKANRKVVLKETEKPTSVGINARLKQQNVEFDPNGGSGTMPAQIFEHSILQELTENSFEKEGDVFTGWNSEADGTGAAYTNKQPVAFEPENDGESITLYAQWEEVPDAAIMASAANNGWYAGEVTLNAPDGYHIAKSPDDSWSDSISYRDGEDGNITYYLKNENGSIAEKTMLLKIDSEAPTAAIEIDVNKWMEFWNDLTFSLLFNKTQDVTISAGDRDSGVYAIEYYLADSELQLDDVKTVDEEQWERYNGGFKIDPNGRYVVYAKVTDMAGNVTYINSDGIELDDIAPTLEGIEDGKTYYGDLTVIKKDEQFHDIKIVTVDGEPMDFVEGKYGLIPADNKQHEVVVEDHAGNKTVYTVTVMENYNTGETCPEGTETGDDSNAWLWLILMALSGLMIGLIVSDRKRKTAR